MNSAFSAPCLLGLRQGPGPELTLLMSTAGPRAAGALGCGGRNTQACLWQGGQLGARGGRNALLGGARTPYGRQRGSWGGAHRCGCACGSPGSWRWDSSCGTEERGRRARWGRSPWACRRRRRPHRSSGGWRSSTADGLVGSSRCGTRCHSLCRGRRLLSGERRAQAEGPRRRSGGCLQLKARQQASRNGRLCACGLRHPEE